ISRRFRRRSDGWESRMSRAGKVFKSRGLAIVALVATLLWSPTLSWAQVMPETKQPPNDPSGGMPTLNADGAPSGLTAVTTADDGGGNKKIQPEVDAAPDEIPTGGSRETLTFTIRNLNSNYSGGSRYKLQVGDKFRINLANCAASISFVYPVDQNVG